MKDNLAAGRQRFGEFPRGVAGEEQCFHDGTIEIHDCQWIACAPSTTSWPGRTSKERVVVRGSGTVSASQWIRMRDYTVLDVGGEVQHLSMINSSYYGVFL